MEFVRRFGGMVFVGAACLTGCAQLERLNLELGGTPAAPAANTVLSEAVPNSRSNSPEALDQSTTAERAAATAVRTTGRTLGQTVASLGSASEPGFWLKTPLVSDPVSGRVRNPATGKSVAVTLIPIEGPPTAGSRLSLSAMRALEVTLSDLVTLDVSRF